MGKPVTDITGQRYGRLTVLGFYGTHVSPNGTKKSTWRCMCDCGKEIVVASNDLRTLHTRSCGCLKAEANRESPKTHGLRHTRLYNIWANIKQRCNNPNGTGYDLYGGRGIKICKEWEGDFAAFYKWSIDNGYDDTLTIDRINNNGNYEPGNCRWVTQRDQSNNTSRNVFYEHNGEQHTLSEWARLLNLNYDLLHGRIYGSNWDFERAVSTPAKVS